MRKLSMASLSAVLLAGALFAGDAVILSAGAKADSGPYSARVRRACKSDYNRFCPGYSLYGTELRRCMQAAGKAISKPCIRALIDAGEVPRSMLKAG